MDVNKLRARELRDLVREMRHVKKEDLVSIQSAREYIAQVKEEECSINAWDAVCNSMDVLDELIEGMS